MPESGRGAGGGGGLSALGAGGGGPDSSSSVVVVGKGSPLVDGDCVDKSVSKACD